MASDTSIHWWYINKTDSFFYICGDYMTIAYHQTIISLLRTAYYFNCKIRDQDKSWVPQIFCKPCYKELTTWFDGKKVVFNFAISMILWESQNHEDDCYFCLTSITDFNVSSRKKKKYYNLLSATRPVPHLDSFPVSKWGSSFIRWGNTFSGGSC